MQRDDPSGQVAPAHPRPAVVSDLAGQRRLVGPGPDGFGQIPVGLRIAGHHVGGRGNAVKYDPDTRTTVTFPLDDLEQARSLPDLNRQLSNVAGSLLNLSRRSFPSYRPVIVEYAKLVALMQTGKVNSREAVPKISQLREIRNLSMKTARRVRDYMDWYEINTRSGTGKTFASYAAAVKILREQEQPANTPVSRYLDDIEKLYTLPARAPVPSLHGKD